jgi:hypothetical protein
MKIKEGVSLCGLHIVMRKVLQEAESIWKGLGQELVVTSGTEPSEHLAGSLHYYGLALDFRTRYFDEGQRHLAFNKLSLALADYSYTVVLEEDHIHVQYSKPEYIYGKFIK